MNERIAEQWMAGFVKAAEEAGITDQNQVEQLVKVCGRLSIMSEYPDQFEAGMKEAAAAAGMEKAALAPLVGALAIPALYGAYKGVRGMRDWWKQRTDPFGRAGELAQQAHGIASPNIQKARDYAEMIRGQGRQVGGGMGGSFEGVPRRAYPTPYGYGYGYGS